MSLFNTASAAGSQDSMGSLIILGVFMVALYFVVWRPQNKKSKEHKSLVSNLTKGDEVVTSGGIIGKITSVNDKYVILNVSPNVDISFQKTSIANVLPKGMMKQVV